MANAYGNLRDRATPEKDRSVDEPHPKRSISQKIADTLPPPQRDTPRNRRLAKQNGWTDREYQEWVDNAYDEDSVRHG